MYVVKTISETVIKIVLIDNLFQIFFEVGLLDRLSKEVLRLLVRGILDRPTSFGISALNSIF